MENKFENPKELKYTKAHEWLKVEGDKATIGITDAAQSMLGDVVFVELPEVGTVYAAGESIASIESVKAVSDVYIPVRGKILEVNEALEDAPDLINKEAFGEGWIAVIELADLGELGGLLSAEEYGQYLIEGENE